VSALCLRHSASLPVDWPLQRFIALDFAGTRGRARAIMSGGRAAALHCRDYRSWKCSACLCCIETELAKNSFRCADGKSCAKRPKTA